MIRFKKIAAVALASATFAVAMAPTAEAQYRRHYHSPRSGWAPGGAIAAGVLGGALMGAMIAAPRPVYAAPVYEPVYPEECYRAYIGRDGWGRRLYRTVCE